MEMPATSSSTANARMAPMMMSAMPPPVVMINPSIPGARRMQAPSLHGAHLYAAQPRGTASCRSGGVVGLTRPSHGADERVDHPGGRRPVDPGIGREPALLAHRIPPGAHTDALGGLLEGAPPGEVRHDLGVADGGLGGDRQRAAPQDLALLDQAAFQHRLGARRDALGQLLAGTVSYTHLRAHETDSYLVCRLLLE